MGIKGEIGPGTRIALTKLAIETFEKKRRPLRIAIDVSIWQFQTQAGQGGTNPAIRTFYYRLLRLLSISVQPIFVFDGPHKPKIKRNKRVGQGGAMVPNMLTKQMLKLFGFPFHMAPGEAEAECALLQKEGIVDAVLSEDVDTLMFGCGTTLRNWSSDGARGNKSPTHVSLYDAQKTREGPTGLDREGMVLVAMMSGGDYAPEGIPGCGIKIACEAARAGFGKTLCQIRKSDDSAFAVWRSHLIHEVQTNDSKFFRQKHKSLNIPPEFPNREILGFYTHPVVSSAAKIESLKVDIIWDGEMDIQGLRAFVAEAFEWTNKGGARKFIRGLAPALLVQKLRQRADRRASGHNDLVLTAMNEMEYVREICGRRTHFSTDGIPELRLIYQPGDIVGIDMEVELDDSEDISRDGLATYDDEQLDGELDDEPGSKRGPSQYDPTQPDKVWVARTIAKLGVPLKVEDYEESQRDPQLFLKQKATAKRAAKKKAVRSDMPTGSMDRFVQVTKSVSRSIEQSTSEQRTVDPGLPPAYLAPALASLPSLPSSTSPPARVRVTRSKQSSVLNIANKAPSKAEPKVCNVIRPNVANANPWTLAQSQPHAHANSNLSPRITKSAYSSQKQIAAGLPEINTIDLLSSSPTSFHQSTPLPRPPRSRSPNPSTPSKDAQRAPSRILTGSLGENEVEFPTLPRSVTRTRGSRPLGKSLFPSSEDESEHSSVSPRKRRSLDSNLSSSSPQRMLNRTSASPSPGSSPPEAHDVDISPQTDQSDLAISQPTISPVTIPTSQRPSATVIDLSSSPPPNLSQSSSSPAAMASVPPASQDSPTARFVETRIKKILMLRESIGGFQELDEAEWETRKTLETSGTKMRLNSSKASARRVKPRKAFRISQVEILDLRD